MTDKQIINGIDVSECIFHSLTTMGYAGYNYCKCFECACECHDDCHYKQLKRKQQECEKYKQTLAGVKPILEIYANTKVGEEQLDGTSQVVIEDSGVLGSICLKFDPNPARQALQKTNEVLNDRPEQN